MREETSVMTETIEYIRRTLDGYYPSGEIKALVRLIMERVCGIQPYQFYMGKGRDLSDKERTAIRSITERLTTYEPIQYIFGKADFCGLEFAVTPAVLIPRPETEELVELIVRDYPQGNIDILDIGTGSGCIAVALCKMIHGSRVSAIDISPEALAVARKNALNNRVEVVFHERDILRSSETAESIHEMFDVIVSNPPYVMEKEKAEMERNVLGYEPSLALFVPDDDPLVYYRHISRFARRKLKAGGRLYLEINAQMGDAATRELRMMEFSGVKLIRDLSGKHRFVKAEI